MGLFKVMKRVMMEMRTTEIIAPRIAGPSQAGAVMEFTSPMRPVMMAMSKTMITVLPTAWS